MEPSRAKEILQRLADGRDPATGEQLPPNNPYQQADTVRALYLALETLEKGGRRREARLVDPNKPKVGANWTPEKKQQLRDAFATHKPIPKIAAAHGRTTGAITARLVKLGLIEDNPTNRAGQGNRSASRPVPPPPSSSFRPTPAAPTELTQEEKDNLPF